MKSYSLRKKLSFRLAFLIGLTLFFTLIASFINTKHEVKKLFDANLVKTSKLILGLIKHEIAEEQDPYFFIDPESIKSSKQFHNLEYKLHSQAWSNSRLIYNSDENFIISEPQNEGFFDLEISQEKWRVFAIFDDENSIKVAVFEKYELQNDLIYDILTSLTAPFFFCIFVVIYIIFRSINKGLKPLGDLSYEIEKMSSETLKKFDKKEIPNEMRPFVNSFNDLIFRLKNSLESERRFTDYAAHELRTPLAAIKAQAQLLLKNKDREKQKEFLQDLLEGIKRTTDMVEKLLVLTRLEPENEDFIKEEIHLSHLIKSILEEFVADFSLKLDNSIKIFANRLYIEILLKNLIENAVKYGKKGEKIEILLKNDVLEIKNKGDFIEKNEEKFIFNNFFRAKNKKSTIGSGLGLAICKKIVDLHGFDISYVKDVDFNVMRVVFGKK